MEEMGKKHESRMSVSILMDTLLAIREEVSQSGDDVVDDSFE